MKKKYHIVDFIILLVKVIPLPVILTTFFKVLGAILPAYQTIALADFIDIVTQIFQGEKTTSDVFMPLLFILICIIYEKLVPAIENVIHLSAENKLSVTLGEKIVQKRSYLKYQYIENKDMCDLIERVCTEPERRFLDGFLNIQNGIAFVIRIVSLLAIVIAYTPLEGMIILAVCIPLFYIAQKMGKKNYEMEKDAAKIKRKYHYLAEILTKREYVEERSLYHYSDFICSKFNQLFDQSYKVEAQIEKKRYMNMKSGSMFTIGIAVIIMTILLLAVQRGNMTLGIYIALVSTIFSLVQSMSWQLSSVMQEYARLKEYLKDFSEFFFLEEKEGACDEPADISNFLFQSLEFKNVSFRYPKTDHDILKNCSFYLSKNKSYAFVGSNGAGKTTITKLLMGLYDNYEGEILINGKNIRNYPYSELKAMISVVFQDFSKYAISIRHNISLGSAEKENEEKLRKVLKKVELMEIIDQLEKKENTSLGKLEEGSIDF